MSTSTRLITYEDSLTMPENRFEEIVHGESRIMPPAIKKHNYLVRKLSKVLERQLDDSEYEVHSQGAGLGIERIPLTYRIPDLIVFRAVALRRDSRERSLYLGRPRTDRRMPFAIQSQRLHSRTPVGLRAYRRAGSLAPRSHTTSIHFLSL
jgi:hypothetical protein